MSEMTEGAQVVPQEDGAGSNLRWYIVHAYSGMEKAVERNILERIKRSGMQEKFGRILVPTEEVVEVRNGQRRTTERRLYPGYVFVQMLMDDDTWHLIKHTNKVTGFVGGAKNRPAPISDEEVRKIESQVQEVRTSPGTRLNSSRAKWCASRTAPSPTSTEPSRRSTMKRVACAWR